MPTENPASPAGSPLIVPRAGHGISRKNIDDEALKVLYRLHGANYKAYLVGGAVRDLLLGKRPSDFDIGTSATPEEIRRLFKNSRIIGRRFRLVQVVFRGRKVVEVATFRREPDFAEAEEELMKASPPPDVAEDEPENGAEPEPAAAAPAPRRPVRGGNEIYGNDEDDARRRDITINGLFYDIGTFAVIDYVGGLQDLADRVVRFIGDPATKVKEDPVRIIRALRHAARTGFAIEAETAETIRRLASSLAEAHPSRIAWELQRDLKSGHSARVFQLMRQYGVLPALLPELTALSESAAAEFDASLARLDAASAAGGGADPTEAAAVLFWPLAEPVVMKVDGKGDPGHALHQRLSPAFRRIGLSRRDGAVVELLYLLLRRVWTPSGVREAPPTLARRPQWPRVRSLYALLTGLSLPESKHAIPHESAETGEVGAEPERTAPEPAVAAPIVPRPSAEILEAPVRERRFQPVARPAPAERPVEVAVTRRGGWSGLSPGAGAEPYGF